MVDAADTRNIYERIEAARPNFKPVVRNAEGQVGTRHYNYADLDVVCDAVEAALLAEGVGIFPTVFNDSVRTELRVIAWPGGTVDIPGSGALVSCEIPLPADLTPQQTGSAITYFRRYGLVALLNLRTEPDDDGGQASRPARTRVTNGPDAGIVLPEPELPAGWDSHEQAQAAHTALRERILGLPEEFAEQCIAFRQTHGWPLDATKFGELEEVVRVAEGFGA